MGRQGSDENWAALEVLSAAPFSPGSVSHRLSTANGVRHHWALFNGTECL